MRSKLKGGIQHLILKSLKRNGLLSESIMTKKLIGYPSIFMQPPKKPSLLERLSIRNQKELLREETLKVSPNGQDRLFQLSQKGNRNLEGKFNLIAGIGKGIFESGWKREASGFCSGFGAKYSRQQLSLPFEQDIRSQSVWEIWPFQAMSNMYPADLYVKIFIWYGKVDGQNSDNRRLERIRLVFPCP